ncbi:MAG: EamA family transporter [Rhizobiaceae bacterium]|nr:EamA family transporter [Rhizobiaceae bacterium]MBL4696734.1 EamA family transporter [Rhizobiaceae bacterium]
MGPNAELTLTLVLGAAFLHAFWNALVKGSVDRAVTLALVQTGGVICGLFLVFNYMPPAREAWPFLAASTIIHFLYYAFLLLSYRFGDLSQVYPISRGISPVIVATGAWIFVGEVLPPMAMGGLLLITSGIAIIFFARLRGTTNWKAIGAALCTGMTIASYTVVDGMGIRSSQSPLGYIGWLFVLEFFASIAIFIYRRHALATLPLKVYGIGILGGVVSSVAYGLAMYAQGLAPFAAVSAIRESSVLIAALIGVVWFKERPWKPRVFAAFVVAAGVILLASS